MNIFNARREIPATTPEKAREQWAEAFVQWSHNQAFAVAQMRLLGFIAEAERQRLQARADQRAIAEQRKLFERAREQS